MSSSHPLSELSLPTAPPRAARPQSLIRRTRLAVSSAVAAMLGLAPHVLHHVGPLAGAALLGGVGGSLLFGAIGFVAAVPFLVKLHRRCGDWRIPAGVLALMAVVFSVSTFVVGPAVSGRGDSGGTQPAPQESQGGGHLGHH